MIWVFDKSLVEFFHCNAVYEKNNSVFREDILECPNPPCSQSNCKSYIIHTYSACVNSVELGTIAATKASLFVVRKFFNMNSMHGTHTFCLQMSGLSVFFRKPLNHFLRNATHSPYYSHSWPTTRYSWYVCKKTPCPPYVKKLATNLGFLNISLLLHCQKYSWKNS